MQPSLAISIPAGSSRLRESPARPAPVNWKYCPRATVPSFFIRRRTTPSSRSNQGVPLGILPEFNSGPPTKIQMKQGDIFLLITDGFVEFENPAQEEFGKLRLKETVRASRDLPPDEIIKSLYDAVLAHSKGTTQQDDLTAVLIKRV